MDRGQRGVDETGRRVFLPERELNRGCLGFMADGALPDEHSFLWCWNLSPRLSSIVFIFLLVSTGPG
jgi:hypothetical protein